ncbi:hypothetical protein HG530_002279 [Fusarium avenaceum]|nr:hypothetical protein HG530_002279 [Fusarium avenaceum]
MKQLLTPCTSKRFAKLSEDTLAAQNGSAITAIIVCPHLVWTLCLALDVFSGEQLLDSVLSDDAILIAELQAFDGFKLNIVGTAQEDKITACFDGHNNAVLNTKLVTQSLHLQAFRDCNAIEPEFVS